MLHLQGQAKREISKQSRYSRCGHQAVKEIKKRIRRVQGLLTEIKQGSGSVSCSFIGMLSWAFYSLKRLDQEWSLLKGSSQETIFFRTGWKRLRFTEAQKIGLKIREKSIPEWQIQVLGHDLVVYSSTTCEIKSWREMEEWVFVTFTVLFCPSASGVGHIVRTDGIMNDEKYRQVMFHQTFPSGRYLIGNAFIFRPDNLKQLIKHWQ